MAFLINHQQLLLTTSGIEKKNPAGFYIHISSFQNLNFFFKPCLCVYSIARSLSVSFFSANTTLAHSPHTHAYAKHIYRQTGGILTESERDIDIKTQILEFLKEKQQKYINQNGKPVKKHIT